MIEGIQGFVRTKIQKQYEQLRVMPPELKNKNKFFTSKLLIKKLCNLVKK